MNTSPVAAPKYVICGRPYLSRLGFYHVIVIDQLGRKRRVNTGVHKDISNASSSLASTLRELSMKAFLPLRLFVEDYFNDKFNGRPPADIASSLKNIISFYGDERDVQDIDLKDYIDFRVRLGVSIATIKNNISAYRTMFVFCQKLLGYSFINDPSKNAIFYLNQRHGKSTPVVEKRSNDFLSETEYIDVVRIAFNLVKKGTIPEAMPWAIILMTNCGLRFGELMNLKERQLISSDKGLFALEFTQEDQKNGKHSLLECNEEASRALMRLLDIKRQEKDETEFIIINNVKSKKVHGQMGNGRFAVVSFRKYFGIIASYFKRPITPHMLRKTTASLMVQNKVEVFTASKALRHGSASVTEKFYAREKSQNVSNAFSVLGSKIDTGDIRQQEGF